MFFLIRTYQLRVAIKVKTAATPHSPTRYVHSRPTHLLT